MARKHTTGRLGRVRPDVGQRPDLEGQVSIFVAVDYCSAECIGIHAAHRAMRFGALEPFRKGMRACFGAFANAVAVGLELRYDHGSRFVADDFQRELAFLGITSSPAFVREPEGYGCAERFIRTRKEKARSGSAASTASSSCASAPRLQGHLQPDLDGPAPQLPDAGPVLADQLDLPQAA